MWRHISSKFYWLPSWSVDPAGTKQPRLDYSFIYPLNGKFLFQDLYSILPMPDVLVVLEMTGTTNFFF